MSTDVNDNANDQVERLLLAALEDRANVGSSSDADDDALIAAVVAAHLDSAPPQVAQLGRRRKNIMPLLAATGLLAAAAAAALWLLPAGQGVSRDATKVAQVDRPAVSQSVWVMEREGTPLAGVVIAKETEACGERAGTRACLAPRSRGTFHADGNLELEDGTARVQANEAIVVLLADVRVRASTETANFSATRRGDQWAVLVESGVVNVTGPDGSTQTLEAGQSVGSEPPEVAAVPVDTVGPDTATEIERPEPVGKVKATPKPTPSADELVTLARSQRAARDFVAAAKTYEQLLRAHPKSSKSRSALVSLGQLYQGPLDDPAKALRHFDHYLDRGGPLAEEAHYGKIRALRSLGRDAKAKTEVEAFLSAYPNSVHADALR